MNIWITRNVEFYCTDVQLSYSSNGIKFILTPEFPDCLKATFPRGNFDSGPSNGTFRFQWDIEQKWIEFDVGKAGDGQGGDFYIRIPLTNEDCEQLEKSLIMWEEAFKPLPKE